MTDVLARGRAAPGRAGLGVALLALVLAGCSAPGPAASALAAEPVLRPPVEAVELGRTTQEGQRGWLLGVDSGAVIEVVYAVPLPSTEAAQAWVEAYGDDYGLQVPREGSLGQTFGGRGEVGVELVFGDEASAVVGAPEGYQPVPAGHSAVTLRVNARVD